MNPGATTWPAASSVRSRGCVYSSRDGGDFITTNANVGSEPGTARAVDNPGVSDDEVIGRDLRPQQNEGYHQRKRHREGNEWAAFSVHSYKPYRLS